jgi:methionyl-tRNA formyltransferase
VSLRVSVIGQAAFGADAVDALRDDGHEVVAVSAPRPAADGPADALWAKAAELGLPALDTRELAKKQPDWLNQFSPDLGVMAFVTAILPKVVLETPRHGTIEYHPSLLPRHRGRSAINWSIIQGDPKTGLTIFWVDEGVDTGPILLQRQVDVAPDDTVGSLYFQKLYPQGIEAIKESVRLIEEGNSPRLAQDEKKATYEPPCEDEHAAIDWSAPAQTTYNLIRGTNPQPGAHATFRGSKIRIYDCELLGTAGDPGAVIEVEPESFVVGLAHGTLRVKRVASDTGKKVAAGEWARSAGLSAGDHFGP